MDFTWDNNVTFDFSDACLFRHPVYFNGQDFLSVTSDFSWQWFNVVKLREMLSPKRVTRHYFGTAWPLMIFLVSFVPRLSPKQSRCFTNFHLQIIGDITVWRLQPGPPKNFQPIKNHSFNKELGADPIRNCPIFWLVSFDPKCFCHLQWCVIHTYLSVLCGCFFVKYECSIYIKGLVILIAQ